MNVGIRSLSISARSACATLGAALTVLILSPCAPAAAAPRVVDLHGLRGKSVDIAAGVRLADAGAVIAATLERRGATRVALVRLRHDGTVVDGFGDGGVASIGPAGGTAVAVASDAAGRRIVAALRGPAGRLRLFAVDGRGRRRTSFGRDGVLTFGPARSVALAARGARLELANGPALAKLDARSGETLAEASAADCLEPLTAVMAGGRLIVAGDSAGCPSAIDVYGAGTLANAGSAPIAGQRALALQLHGERTLCVAEQDGARARTRRADPTRLLERDPLAGAPALAAPDRLIGLAPDPRGGCNLLLARPSSGGRVVQADRAGRATQATALPPAFRPRVLFVCRSHVLTAGVRRSRGKRVGALAVVKRHRDG